MHVYQSKTLCRSLLSARRAVCLRRSLSSSSTVCAIPPTYPTLARVRDSRTPPSSLPDVQVDHLVVGAGVVGLAVAYALSQRFPHKSTYLLERHERFGEETSSRNSEVIHAGLFYPSDSLKTNLCLRGRDLLYDFCRANNVPHRQTGKLTVGTQSSREYLEGIVQHVSSLSNVEGNVGALVSGPRSPPPLQIISGDEARRLEPDLGPNVGWTLDSPRTGIVDSHELMAALEKLILDSDCAEIVYDTSVVGIQPVNSSSISTSKRGTGDPLQGWLVETHTEGGGEDADSLLARHVINTSGLSAPAMLNTLLRDGHFGAASADARSKVGMWYSKGNYASYSKAKGGVDRVGRLIYPLPDMGSSSDKHGHQGLGTHLTLDMLGNVRFGPDTDWLSPPPNNAESEWWLQNLIALQPSASTQSQLNEDERLDAMHANVSTFLPGVRREGLAADYAGIRPKLVGPGGGFVDFTIYYHGVRHLDRQPVKQAAFDVERLGTRTNDKDLRDALYAGAYEAAQPSLVSLCGIESPGLTSSLALGEVVSNLIARRGWGLKVDVPSTIIPKGAQNEEAGHVDQWA